MGIFEVFNHRIQDEDVFQLISDFMPLESYTGSTPESTEPPLIPQSFSPVSPTYGETDCNDGKKSDHIDF